MQIYNERSSGHDSQLVCVRSTLVELTLTRLVADQCFCNCDIMTFVLWLPSGVRALW